MKILIVQTYHYNRGGDCTYGFSLANLLTSYGHQVNFFGMKHPLNLPCEDVKYFVDYIDYREVNANKNIINGMGVVSRSIYSIHVKKKFKNIIADKKPDIIHIQNLHGHMSPSILYEAKKNKIPVVMTLHDYKFICPNTHLLSHGNICEKCKVSKYYNCILNKCKKNSISASMVATLEAYVHKFVGIKNLIDIYIAPSKFLKYKFVEFGWNQSKIKVINNFLAPKNYDNNSTLLGAYVLYFGQLEPWKGIFTLLKAAKELPQIPFKIVGDGTIQDDIIEKISDNKILNVELLGYKTGEELNRLIKNARLIAMPSEWYENYPYSIMEAMAFGKPVIASKIGGLPELVKDGSNSFLFEKGNYKELSEKIKLLFSNNEKCIELGQNAFGFATENLNEKLFYNRISTVYNSLIV
jgi:glycosyltransferase involved in cell wall biosynthesis